MNRLFIWLLPLAFFASCTNIDSSGNAPASGSQSDITNVSLYRGLKVNSENRIIWTKESFGVSGKPVATLSFFDSANNDGIACWLKITVAVEGDVEPQVVGMLTIPKDLPNGPKPGPWAVTFDNDPPGHWSIEKDTIGGKSNTAASTNAAIVFTAMARDDSAPVIDGSRDDCAPPQ